MVDNCNTKEHVVSRRAFLQLGSATLITLTLPPILRKVGMPMTLTARAAAFERKVIGKVSELKVGESISFQYPYDHISANNFLIMLESEAGGGVGPDKNIVAFHSLCTHQGGPMAGTFHGDGIAGPCPLHLTTFDLNRHGMVIAGHATVALPQIMLEVDGDDIVATGVLGLIYGYQDNAVDPATL